MGIIKDTYDTVYGVIENIDRGILWNLQGLNLIGNEDYRDIWGYSARFKVQFLTAGYTILTGVQSSPIRKTVELLCKQYASIYGTEELKNFVKSALPKLIVKKLTTVLTIDYIVNQITKNIIEELIAIGAISKTILKQSALILTEQGIEQKSYQAAMELSKIYPATYSLLLNNDVECFWFLIDKYLYPFAAKIG